MQNPRAPASASPLNPSTPGSGATIMADGEPQRQLLHLIRDFATEKTQGERRVSDLKKRLLELQVDSESASVALDKAKRAREAAERELRGSQAQLDRTSASLLALQTRILGLQDEISKISSELHLIQNDGGIQRDEFIRAMHEFNGKIRKLNEMTSQALMKGHPDLPADNDPGMDMQSENTLKDLENEMLSWDAEMHRLEEEYQKATHDVNMVHEELVILKKRVSLSEAIIQKSEHLKDMSCQISELEKTYSSLGEELQRRYTCPKCNFNNTEASEWTSEAEGTSAA